MIRIARTLEACFLFALLSFLQAAPARAQFERVQLSNLTLLPGDARLAPAAATQETPRISSGGRGYLVVWADHRSALTPLAAFSGGPYLSPGIGSMRDIYAARLDQAGTLLDSIPILVAQQTLNQGNPAVAWNGQNWLVVWSGQTGMACCPSAHIFAARVSPDGVVLDPNPIAVATDSQTDGGWGPAVASDGNRWAVVYRSWHPSGISLLVGKRLAGDGTLLDATALELRHDAWNSSPVHPDLVFAGDEYLLVWSENLASGLEGAVRGQRLTSTLSRVGGVIVLNPYSPSQGRSPSVATDGASFFVAWFEDRYTGWAQVFGTRVTHAGAVQDPAGIAITPASGYAQFSPQVAWDGARWFVGYHVDDLLVSRVSTAGAVLDPTGKVVKAGSGADCQPTMAACAGGGVRFAWKDSRAAGPAPEDIYSIAASASGAPGAEACVSLAAPRQSAGRLVEGGGGHLLVFRSAISGCSRILAQRLDAGGAPLDAEPIEVATGANLSSPTAAWNGSLFLITWQDSGPTVYARRMRADGSFPDPAPTLVMTAYTPVVAALGDVFLVAGVFHPNPEFLAPRYVRVRGTDGARLDATPFTVGRYFAVAPAIARLGTRWLLLWEEHPTHDAAAATVFAMFVASDGAAGGAFPITLTNEGLQYAPSVVTGRDTAVVAWQDARGGNANRDIYAQRLLPDGSRLDGSGIRVTSAANDQLSPALSWDGRGFVVGYGDYRNDGTPGIDQLRGDVYASRLDGHGTVLDPDGFAVSRDSIMESDPIAGGGAGLEIVGCSIFQPIAPFASYRIGLRTAAPAIPAAVDGHAPAGPIRLRVTPNPFAGETAITFALPRAGRVRATVHDLQGRELRRLCDRTMPAGPARLAWDGRDERGAPVPSGIYLVSVAAEGRTITTRIAGLR